jgi:hypothetical protein
MREQSFYRWLMDEAVTARVALLGLYEQRDKLLYVQAPQLRKEYMEKIGAVEEDVLQAELETAMLRRKLELVQIALNRREPVDLAGIEEKLEQEKAQRLQELEGEDITLAEMPLLSAEEAQTLQQQYKEITEAFHPAVNPNITQTQKELYTKAVEAYQAQDAQAMNLIYELLFPAMGMGGIKLSFDVTTREKTEEDVRKEYGALALELSADYRLAKELYGCFRPLEEDVVVRDKLNEYTAQRKALEEQIAEIRVRARNAEEEKAALNAKIQTLTEGCVHD